MEIFRKIYEKNVKRKAIKDEKIRLRRHEFLLQNPEFPHKEGCQRYNGLVRTYEVFVSPFNMTTASYPTGQAECTDCGVSAKLEEDNK